MIFKAILIGLVGYVNAYPGLKQTLDDMEAHFHGAGHTFDDVYYKNLTTCFAKYNDTLLLDSQDNAWK